MNRAIGEKKSNIHNIDVSLMLIQNKVNIPKIVKITTYINVNLNSYNEQQSVERKLGEVGLI